MDNRRVRILREIKWLRKDIKLCLNAWGRRDDSSRDVYMGWIKTSCVWLSRELKLMDKPKLAKMVEDYLE
jgi:hypothetical protein